MARKPTRGASSGERQPPFKDSFAAFFEDPSRAALRTLLQDETGETRELDFKREWPKPASLAKHVLGMANAGRGVLIAGVEESDNGTLDPIGLPDITDKATLLNGVKGFLPTPLRDNLFVHNFSYEESEYAKIQGKLFQVLFVRGSLEHVPFVALKDGEGIREGAIYMRREGTTSEASYDEVQRLVNKRIETGYSSDEEMDLKVHVEQLKVLVAELPQRSSLFDSLSLNAALFGAAPHPLLQAESLADFLARMIRKKKLIIAEMIGVAPEDARAAEDLITGNMGTRRPK